MQIIWIIQIKSEKKRNSNLDNRKKDSIFVLRNYKQKKK